MALAVSGLGSRREIVSPRASRGWRGKWSSALLCCGALVVCAPAVAGNPAIAGVGARPLNDRVAATWFIEEGSTLGERRMAVMVFLAGPAGWTKKRTDWRWRIEDPAYSSFVTDGETIRVEYSCGTGRWTVLTADGNVKNDNVVVVADAGTPRQRVIHVEKLHLRAGFDSDPIVEVLKQSGKLRQILGL